MHLKHITSKPYFRRPRTVILNGICLAFFLICSAAYAQTTYYLDNVVFNSGATATGSFDYDGQIYSNVNVRVSNSPNYGSPNFAFAITRPDGFIENNTQFEIQTVSDQFGEATLYFSYTEALDSGSVNINLLTGESFLGRCDDSTCELVTTPLENAISGRVTTDPPPTAVCQDFLATLNPMGMATIVPSNIDGGSSDNALGFNLTIDKSSFTCADLGANTVTLTITDANGSKDSCTATVNVVDITAPAISCSGAITINGFSSDGMGLCSALVTVPAPTVSDNCSVASITNDFNNTNDASGIYPLGDTTVIWTITDTSGNSNTCTQIIAVNDTEAPTISCPADITVNHDAGECGALINVPAPTVTDNCDFTLTNDFTNSGEATAVYPIGTTTVTWTATDPSGNSNICTQTITVNADMEVPLLTCPSDMAIECGATINFNNATTSDNCGFPTVPNSIVGFTPFGTFGGSTYFLATGVTNANNAYALAQANGYDILTINSQAENNYILQRVPNFILTNPILLGYNDVAVDGTFVWQSGQPTFYENWNANQPSGNAGEDFTALNRSSGIWNSVTSVTSVHLILEFHDYSIGAIQVTGVPSGSVVKQDTINTFFSKDLNGNISTCTQNITVNPDSTNPTINCAADVTVSNTAGLCTANVNVPSPTIMDACSPNADLILTNDYSLSDNASGIYPVGTTVVTWTVTDAAGNSSICTQNIIVNDTENPSITCPADISTTINPDVCEAMVTVPAPTIADNCPNLTVTNDFTGTSDASGTYPLGTTTVTWTVTDAAGNPNTCTQAITVNGAITCADDITVSVSSGMCNAMVSVTAPTVANNCSNLISLTNDYNNTTDASDVYAVGTTLVTWTATFAGGLTTHCIQRIRVTETTAPSIVCPADINLSCPQVVSYATPTTSDNCSFPTVPISVSGFTQIGTFGDSTYFISDTQMTGPQAFAMANANGYDLVTINSIEENNALLGLIETVVMTSDVFLGYNDVQTEGTFVWQSGQPNFFENWDTSDDEPNAADYAVYTSNEFLWYTVPDSYATYVVLEFHDYTSGSAIQVAGRPSGALITNTTVNTFFSKDSARNISTCSFTVIVDDPLPTITCAPDINVNVDANACTANLTVTPPTVSDNCGSALIPDSASAFYNFNLNGQLIDTQATFRNASIAMEDVQLRITISGDHGGANESFTLTGPDNTTILDIADIAGDCEEAVRILTIPMNTWNTWVNTYGTSLIFTVLADADVDDSCYSYFQISAINLGSLSLINDFNNTSNASGIYPTGTTTITWTVTDLWGNSSTCIQTVTVTETEVPLIACPGNFNINTDSGLCSTVVNYSQPTVTDNCSFFTNSLENVLNNFNQNSARVTDLIPLAYNFVMDATDGVNANNIEDGGFDMYDDGNLIGTDLNAGPITYSDNTVINSTAFGTNGAFFTRKVDNMWLLAADLDNVNTFDITGELGADSSGLADGFTSTLTVGGVNYNIFVKRVREETPTDEDSDPSVNHLIIIPENSNATQNFSVDTDDDQHQVTGLSGTTRLYYLLFASANSGLVDNATMESIATSFINNIFKVSGTLMQTAGLSSGSAFPVGTTTNTFVATDASGNQRSCSFTVTVNDPSGNCNVKVSPKVYLQGSALNSTIAADGLMRDDLRTNGLIPLNTPYADNVSINSLAVLFVTGSDAIVDWVWVELRDAMTNTIIVEGKSALLQRDGDVVALDGTSPVMFNQLSGNYHVVIKHRNHLGIMSNTAVALSTSTTVVDFTDGSTATFGTNAQTTLGLPNGTFALWVGDTNGDAVIQYTGGVQDTPSILSEVLNDNGNFLGLPTFLASGYSDRDLNMDGKIQYAGGNSELPFILQNVLDDPRNFLNLSTWPINAQLPTTMVRAMQLRNTFENSKN
ncbi:MAG: HYR domain-containing protein [Bacteroidota bacterium]